MKTIAILLSILAVALSGSAQVITNLLPAQTVSGTVTGGWYVVGQVYVPTKKYYIQNPGITNPAVYVTNVVGGVTNIVNTITNSQTTVFQLSLDQTNVIAGATYKPATTNANWDTPPISFTAQNLYLRVVQTATNPAPMQILIQ